MIKLVKRIGGQLDAFPETVNAVSSEDDERFTLYPTVQTCTGLANVRAWDLDVAACDLAHIAPKFYTKKDNGLLSPWWGRVWCNPPWSGIGPWVEKAWSEWDRRHVKVIGMLLPATRTDIGWWQEFVEPYRDLPMSPLRVRFLPGRIQYGQPNDLLAEHAGTPNFGSVFLWWKQPAQVTKRRKGKKA